MKRIVFLIASLFLLACDSPSNTNDNTKNEKQDINKVDTQKEESKLQGDYQKISSITFGSGGGFTGGWQGTTVQKDGKIFLVQKMSGEEQKDELVTTPQKVAPIFEELKKIEFLKINSKETGNMTSNVYVSIGSNKKHEITFPMEKVPSPKLQELLQKIEILVNDVMEQK